MIERIAAYRKRLRIDRDRIDDEVSEHAELFEHVAEKHVLAAADRDALQQELDELSASLDAGIREAIVESKNKLTETAVKQALRDTPAFQKLTRELLDARLPVDQWSVLKEAFGQRSYMLKELVGLYIARRLSGTSHSAKDDLRDYSAKRVRDERARSLR